MRVLFTNGATKMIIKTNSEYFSKKSKSHRQPLIGFLFGLILISSGCALSSNMLVQKALYGGPHEESKAFTIAVLPDTQVYSQDFPGIFNLQANWLAKNVKRLNIKAVMHLGDVTNHNFDFQWSNARKAMNRLLGEIPYIVVPGNHDNLKQFNKYFGIKDLNRQKTFRETYDKEKDYSDNSYHTFKAGGKDWLVLALEWGPRDDVLRWANEVVEMYPSYLVILITHAYMYNDNTRYDWAKKGDQQLWNPHSYKLCQQRGVNDGQEIWEKLVSQHNNFVLVLSGHVLPVDKGTGDGDGLALLESKALQGNSVYQMLVNYQLRKNGGNGWLRLLTFYENSQAIGVKDYSPFLKKFNEEEQSHFTLKAPFLSKIICKDNDE